MTRVWLYVLGALKDPDRVRCVVPWRVDKDLIFFGPCMKRLRKEIRNEFLSPGCSCSDVTDGLYMVGVNASSPNYPRKIVWAGRLCRVMTFHEAHESLAGDRFQKLRQHEYSPLHVRPLQVDGRLIGYERVSREHAEDLKWVRDLASPLAIDRDKVRLEEQGRQLMLSEGVSPWNGFDLDCCMLLKNLFFAMGRGIGFDDEALAILKQCQPDRSDEIDERAIFGLDINGDPIGLRGWRLEITGDAADRFVAWVRRRATELADDQQDDGDGPTKTHCT